MPVALHIFFLTTLLIANAHANNESEKGSIVFTDSSSKQLLRLDDGAGIPRVIAHDIATYGGLLPWKDLLLVATRNHKIAQIDPWCNSSCPPKYIVDVPKALGVDKVVDVFSVGDMTLCGDDSLFIVYGGNRTHGHSGVLRCVGCEPHTDCTSKCSVVNGGDMPGAGMHQLGGWPAGVECVADNVLVVDNTNLRVQAIPVSCPQSPCSISTFASKLGWPLGIAKVRENILITLDATIESFSSNGSHNHTWSIQRDCGYLVQHENNVFVADRNIISFDAGCQGSDCKSSMVWTASQGILAYGGITHVTRPTAPQ